jgi:hypothetical protein
MKNFKHYMQLQMLELEEHKYYLSEKMGYDIGENETIFNWIDSGHAQRFNEAYSNHEEEIETLIQTNGHITKSQLHEVLGD